MPISKQQIEQEKAKAAQMNKVAEQVIGYTGWGRFYPLMRGAASIGEGMTPHKVCVDKNGRDINVYNSTTGKILGSFFRPAHEDATTAISQGDYGQAAIDLAGWGWIKNVQDQFSDENNCLDIIPQMLINYREGYYDRLLQQTQNPTSNTGAGSNTSSGGTTKGGLSNSQSGSRFFDGDKILGMNKGLAIGLFVTLGVLALSTGGYFYYRHLTKVAV